MDTHPMTERRPPLPVPQAPVDSDTPRDGSPAFADTPRDGTPAFGDTDEIQVSFDSDAPAPLAKDTVPPVGPSPDHASEYVPPRPLPKPAEHKTMENIPVKVSPEAGADPRRLQTQKAMRVLEREEAQRHLMLLGVSGAAASVPPESRGSHPSLANAESKEKSRVGLALGLLISFLVLGTLVAIVVKSFQSDDAPAASESASAPPTKAAAQPATVRTTAAPPSTAAPMATPAEPPSATTAPTEAKPPIKKKKPASEQGPKPINE